MTDIKKQLPLLKSIFKSIWFFPALCLVCLLMLTAFKVSGTSAGSYYNYLYGSSAKDSNLLAGRFREVRSDEWEFETQMASAQAETGFPQINKNIGDGQNMAVITDVPYRDWSQAFRPQNLSFFVLPLAYAFAFKWWFLSFMLVVGCYFFILTLLPGKKLLAASLSICLLFTPFVQWWYQTATLAPLAYSLLIAVSAIKLMASHTRKQQVLWVAALGYLLVCFGLVLYPPFQIPCAVVTAIFLLGYFIEKKYYANKKRLLQKIALLAASLVIFLGITGTFLLQNKQALSAIRESYYPGQRVAASGGFSHRLFMSSFLSAPLQITSKARQYPLNQSEASNFLLLSPFLTIAVFYAVYASYKNKKPQDWTLIFVTAVFLLFMVRLFIPRTDTLFKLMGLESVPHARLLIGVGLASFMQIILFIRNAWKSKTNYPKTLALGLGILALAVNLIIGFWVRKTYPGFISNPAEIVLLSIFPALIVTLLVLRKVGYAVALFLLFSLISSAAVNPLYKGMGPIVGSRIIQNIKDVARNDPDGKWAVLDNLTYENVPTMAGAHSITGIYSYPQNSLWQKSPETAEQKDVYNRYAHTLVDFKDGPTILDLKQPDSFVIQSSPCSNFFQEQNVKYFLAENDYSKSFGCLKLDKAIVYPNKTLYILERV